LLLAFAVGLLARLPGILRMLLGISGMFFALCVVAFAVMFGCRAMRLSGILVVLGCLIVFVSSHWVPPIDGWGSVERHHSTCFT
jgi:hypothetical protein